MQWYNKWSVKCFMFFNLFFRMWFLWSNQLFLLFTALFSLLLLPLLAVSLLRSLSLTLCLLAALSSSLAFFSTYSTHKNYLEGIICLTGFTTDLTLCYIFFYWNVHMCFNLLENWPTCCWARLWSWSSHCAALHQTCSSGTCSCTGKCRDN